MAKAEKAKSKKADKKSDKKTASKTATYYNYIGGEWIETSSGE